MITDDPARLDIEIARLRQSLHDAELMRRAVVDETDDPDAAGLGNPGADGAQPPDGATAPPGVTVSNDGEILYANQRFADMLGQRLGQLFAADLSDLVDPRDRAELRAFVAPGATETEIELRLRPRGTALHVVAQARSEDYVSLIVTSGGSESFESDEAMRAVQENRIDGFVVGGERIMLLGEAYRPYQAIVDEMLQGAITISRDGDIIYANERFAAMVNASREQVLGESIYGHFARDDHPALRRICEAGRLEAPCDLTVVGRRGARLPVQVAVLTDDDVGGITLVLTDQTERRRHRRIEEEGRRKDQFLAVLAHELRNPLAPIRNAVEILERCKDLPPQVRYPVAIIGRQTTTLTRLVDDLIDVQRLNEGKIVLKREPCDAAALVRSAVEAAQPLLDAREHRLEVTLPEGRVHVDVDEVRLTQVLVNLLTNAAKYTPVGGRVRLALSAVGDDGADPRTARIEVADNGIGVAAQDLEKMFEPYVQLGSNSSQYGGLGLGLAVARRLAALHGGSINARSDGPGHGCVVTLELPVCPPPAPRVPAPAPITVREAPGALRILVADDNVDAVESMATLLDLMGHQTRIAKDGVEAVEIAEEFRPDVAFLDIGMPRMDGYAAARELRRREWADSLVLCALTGWGQPEDKHRSQEAGFDSHYVKPLDPDVLKTAIRQPRPRRA